jgi:hypothetical protein
MRRNRPIVQLPPTMTTKKRKMKLPLVPEGHKALRSHSKAPPATQNGRTLDDFFYIRKYFPIH